MAALSTIGVVAFMHAIGVGHGDEHHSGESGALGILIGSLGTVLPARVAARPSAEVPADSPRLAEKAQQMERLLSGFSARLEAVASLDDLEGSVPEARHLILLEVAEWASSLRSRIAHFHG